MKAPIREIFCSAQGEGPYIGVRQVFVRFEGCNLSCIYCDTPQDKKSEYCRVESVPGSFEFTNLRNPLSPEEVSATMKRYANVHSISLTGGEPLIYAEFIRELNIGVPLYLESNMSLPEKAAKIKDMVDYVAGDFKLAQAHSSDHYDRYLENMVECFRILAKNNKRDCFCKIVLIENFDKEEIINGVSLIEDYVSVVVLQPVTPIGGLKAPSPKEVLGLQEELSYLDVRIIPQSHVIWGAL
jgi:organic radical activating enzyme